MVSSLLNASSSSFTSSPNKFTVISSKSKPCFLQFSNNKSVQRVSCNSVTTNQHKTCSPPLRLIFNKSLLPPVAAAACIAVVLCSNPAHAGILSGFSGLESVPGPELPQVEFLKDFNEKNQKFYAENDARFKESPILKKLLEQSKLNKEKNRQAILDKYCYRGAEWGVGDCSAEGMSPEDREKFIAMLKLKAGVDE